MLAIYIKLLLLRLIFASFTIAYEFGYHPSAEEFDNLLRETRTWTRDLLANERRHNLKTNERGRGDTLPSVAIHTGRFVPKYNADRNIWQQDTAHKWLGHVQKIDRPSSFVHGVGNDNGDNLEFQMFDNDDDLTGVEDQQETSSMVVYESVNKPPSKSPALIRPPLKSPSKQPSSVTSSSSSLASSTVHVQSDLIEINESNLKPQNITNQQAIILGSEINNQSSHENFPIFFTNPATGIVYAITEVGKTTPTATVSASASALSTVPKKYNQTIFSSKDPTIPIYITKAQYDNDIDALKQSYESKCHTPTHNPQFHNGKRTTKAPITISKLPTNNVFNKTQNGNKKPSSSSSSSIVKWDQLRPQSTTTRKPTHMRQPTLGQGHGQAQKLPNKRRKKKKKNKRTNNNKRPGRKPATPAPLIQMPQVILGTNKLTISPTKSPNKSTQMKVATQLEKPHQVPTTSTVFSALPMVSASGYINYTTQPLRKVKTVDLMEASKHQQQQQQHHMTRRSTMGYVGFVEQLKNTNLTRAARKISSGTPRRRKQNKQSRLPSAGGGGGGGVNVGGHSVGSTNRAGNAGNRNHTMMVPIALHLLHRRNGTEEHDQSLGPMETVSNKTILPISSSSDLLRRPIINSNNTNKVEELRITPRHRPFQEKSKNNGQQKKKRKGIKSKLRGVSENFNFLDLMGGGGDDDDDNYDDDDDDESYYYDDDDDDEDDYVYVNKNKLKNPKHKRKPTKNKIKISNDYSSEVPIVNLKEDVPEDNSSSPEESADFGALEEDQQMPSLATVTLDAVDTSKPVTEISMETTSTESNMKTTNMGKKRIRRRPPIKEDNSNSGSEEDYNDIDDEDDEDDNGGFSGFFRMIFYPVQVAMSRIFDGINGQDNYNDDDTNKKYPKYPTYTLYSNGFNQGSNEVSGDDDYDDEQVNSFTGWLSSLFGLRRKTKKISSTTVAPLTPKPPPPTDEPSWFESWFGFGKTPEPEDYEDKWFFGWFDAKPKPKPKAQRRTTTSTTTTTVQPQVPILTIVDPLRNPQNWIGILANHIANATSTTTSTHNPIIDALTRVTSPTTTTENPDIPRHLNYEKYQIWRLKPQDEAQVRTLEEVKRSEDGVKLQWLKGPSLRGLTDVLVPPKILIDFQGTLSFEGIAHEVLIFDVGKAIAYEQTKEDYLYTMPHKSSKRPNKHKITTQQAAKPNLSLPPPLTWNKYYEYDDIIKYMETIRMRHTQLVELIHIGRSYEGRPLIVVKIEAKQTAAAASAAADLTRRKLKYKRKSGQANAVFIEAGAHGLAWIGPAAATWITNELIRLMRMNKTNVDTDFIRNTTWYIMPVLNPDGYVYSHEYDRFWKKSRSRHIAKVGGGLLNSAMSWLKQKKSAERICHGVDLDRNWQYHWGKRGSSKSPCNEFYAGPTPFSEPETKALSEFLMDYRTQIKLYISLQAYGQVISYPIKANSTFNSERMDDFLDVAMVGTDGLRKKGSKARYKVDSANDLIEQRSGCSDAFAAYEIGIPFSYTIQLADNGVHGYLLPSSSIEPTARDAFEVITSMLDYI